VCFGRYGTSRLPGQRGSAVVGVKHEGRGGPMLLFMAQQIWPAVQQLAPQHVVPAVHAAPPSGGVHGVAVQPPLTQ